MAGVFKRWFLISTVSLHFGISDLSAQCQLELFPQTKSIGINVKLNPGDPEMDCSATVTFTTTPGSKPIEFEGFPLARVKNRHHRLSGVIFYVPFSAEGNAEKVKVVLQDPTTPALDGVCTLVIGCCHRRPYLYLPKYISSFKVGYLHHPSRFGFTSDSGASF
jgi:hypothetical protein